MNNKYQGIYAYTLSGDPIEGMVFGNELPRYEFSFTLDNHVQTQIFAGLVSKHVGLSIGVDRKISYTGVCSSINDSTQHDALELMDKLRTNTPVDSNSESIRNFMLDLAEEIGRLEYIFCTHEGDPIKNRFGWIDALLSDLETLVVASKESQASTLRSPSELPMGGGNLSIPILICTGLELVSALHAGKTDYPPNAGYNATNNVACFLKEYFPSHAGMIPRLTWDGVRNGVDHLFIPKSMQHPQTRIQFAFYVQGPSSVTKDKNNNIIIQINSIEFYNTFRQAINNYKIDLEKKTSYQQRFKDAWNSIENYLRDITKDPQKSGEVQHLLSELAKTDPINLLQ
jgi:hypothetical protein